MTPTPSETKSIEMTHWSRRNFLKVGLTALAGCMLPVQALSAGVRALQQHNRVLAFRNLHTDETLRICYYENGAYQSEALAQINYILRDHRAGTIIDMDPNLLDLLYTVDQRISGSNTFNVISGFRTPKTNQQLRTATKAVAKNSLHTMGQAIDIRLPGYSTGRLRDLCIKLQAGGVGYYPKSNFVHLDTGRVRSW